MTARRVRRSRVPVGVAAAVLAASSVSAQVAPYKVAEANLAVGGVSASVEGANFVVPRNTASGLKVVLRAGPRALSTAEAVAFLGPGFQVRAELSGPGLRQTVALPAAGAPVLADPLLLPLPGLTTAGEYAVSNLRLVANGRAVLDIVPASVTVRVIDQILVTSVRTRALTLEEIRDRGILLDGDAYLGFEFTLALYLESNRIDITLPVVFDREGLPMPPTIPLPPPPARPGAPPLPPLPTIVPVLLGRAGGGDGTGPPQYDLSMPDGQPVRIPSVLVIPGNVGYLKQFFSAQLLVANGAPAGSALAVRDVTATVGLPKGDDQQAGTEDDPLALAPTVQGPPLETLPVRGLGPDGQPGTSDDAVALLPLQQGQAEFLLRGDKEGFHVLDFDLAAVLDGLPVGPVEVSGRATGGVLVRNPYFDMSFTVPTVVRKHERFTVFATVRNIGQGAANDLTVSIDASRLSGAHLFCAAPPCPGTAHIPSLAAGDARTVEFEFDSERTGQVVASYLRYEGSGNPGGRLNFTLGVGERGIPLSPDTLALPAGIDELPEAVVNAAMRVLGQAWSIATAPPERLEVMRIDGRTARDKAIALAEAGLRVQLQQPVAEAVRDLLFDFYGGSAVDPGFDELLRTTEAGRDFARAAGAALAAAVIAAGGPDEYQDDLSKVAVSGPDFLALTVKGTAGPVEASLADGSGRQTTASHVVAGIPAAAVPGAVMVPLGPVATAPYLGLLTAPALSPYVVQVSGPAELALTWPGGQGVFHRAVVTTDHRARVIVDFARPGVMVVDEDTNADGSYDTRDEVAAAVVASEGPRLVSATVIGPETLDGASPFGMNIALLFDRTVAAETADAEERYAVPGNALFAARRQLSGRLVFASLERPEGVYVPTTLKATGIADLRGVARPPVTVPLQSRITEPGAVVSGRVVHADGTPFTTGKVGHWNHAARSDCTSGAWNGVASIPLGADGRYELRYVRQDPCGGAFKIAVRDPLTGAEREVRTFVRGAGEQIVLDIALLGHGAVSGTVRDSANNPVPGAYVTAISGTDAHVGGAAQSDGDGRYTIHGITVGPVNVTAGKGLYLGKGAGRIDRAGGTAVVDVRLEGGSARISGRVYRLENGTTTPVPGIAVVFYLDGTAHALGYAQTGATGDYALLGMPPGGFRLVASLNTRDSATVSSHADEGEVLSNLDLVIEIPPETTFGTVSGTVRLPGGAPAPDVVVSIGSRGVLTGSNGAYSIPGVTLPSNPMVTARTRDGLRTGHAFAMVSAANPVPSGIDITLSGLGTAEFTVLDAAGQPVAGQAVSLIGTCGNPCGCLTRVTGADGRAPFPALGLGGVTARAVRTGSMPIDVAKASATVAEDGATGYGILRFAGSGTVSGLVVQPDGVTPLVGADVVLTSNQFRNDGDWICDLTQTVTRRARTDVEGRFRFTGINAGTVIATAHQEFFATTVQAQGQLANNQELALTLRMVDTIAGRLSGTVFQPDGVTPAGADIEVTANGPLPDVTVRTNAEGYYEFPVILPQGHWWLTARDPFTGGLTRERVFLRAGDAARHDLRLLGRGTVRVRVVDGAEQVVESASVRVVQSEFPFRTYDGSVEPVNDGVVTFTDVVEGPFAVQVSDAYGRGGRASSVLTSVNGEVEVKVALTVTGTVRGRFLMPDGTPIAYGQVRLIAGGRVLGQTTALGSGDIGAFAFNYVPAGPVRLEAQDPRTSRTGLGVGAIESEGQVLDLDVRAQGLGSVQGLVTSNGAPQVGAHVDIVSGSYRAATTADAQGHYVVEGVPEGRVVVTGSLEGGFLMATVADTLVGEAATLTLDVALRATGQVLGTVTEPDRLTPALSQVSLHSGGQGGGSFVHTTTPEGAFDFPRVPSGMANLSVDALGSIDQARGTADVPPAGVIEVPLTLNGVGSIRGRALGSGGAPIAGTLLVSGSGPFGYYHSLRLGPDGLFHLPEVMAGPFTASLRVASAPFTLYGRAAGVVSPDAETEIDVQVQSSGTVTGVIMRAGGILPAFGSEVTYQGAAGTVMVQAQGDGRFTLRGVPLGAFTVRVFDPITTGRAVVGNLALAADGETVDLGTVVLDATPPAIHVVEPADGSVRGPIGGRIVLEMSDADSGVDTATVAVVYPGGFTSGAGFTFENGQALGDLYVGALAVGQNRVKFTVKDLAGNIGERVVTYTATGATIRGRVRWTGGTDAAGVVVAVGSALPNVVTEADGTYVKAGLRPGGHYTTATDPATGIRAAISPSVYDGEETVADVTLPAFGWISGTVRHADGTPAVGVTVAPQWSPLTTTTAANGSYTLGALTLGTWTVVATDTARADVGRATVPLTVAGATETADITLNGVGNVVTTVRDGSGALIPAADLTLTSSSVFPDGRLGVTAADGTASFANVKAGTITVRARKDNLAGEGTGLLTDGATLPVAVTLQAAGTVTGIVSHPGGAVAPGVEVKLTAPHSATTTTDGTGRYTFQGVRTGAFSVEAKQASTGDFGRAAGLLQTQGATVTADITLNGVGSVRVVVNNSAGNAVQGVTVRVGSNANWPVSQSLATGADGVALFPHVPAGVVSVTAYHAATRTGAQATGGTLAPGGSLELTAALQDVGTIRGRVFEPDGATPREGATVTTYVQWQGYVYPVSTLTGPDGAYELSSMQIRSYVLDVHANGRLRARSPSVTLATNGEVVERDIVMVGTGAVTGIVTNPTGAPVSGALVSLRGGPYPFNPYLSATTDGTGRYTIADVALGDFNISATGTVYGQRVDTTGTITHHDETVTLDLHLLANTVTFPAGLTDANDLAWYVVADGSFHGGQVAAANTRAARLSLVHDGVTTAFAGSGASGATEEDKREIVIRQPGLAGLDVTRKVFIPADGYFVRYLEVLENPGAAPVTVDVVEESTLAVGGMQGAVIQSSSGDPVAGADDAWLLVDDANATDIYGASMGQFAPLAIAMAGPGGVPPSSTTMNPSTSTLTVRWNGVTVPPGGSVAFLSLVSAQADRTRGQAAAVRLAQLPPEALAGLTTAEAQAVRNFAVPPDLVSAVEPLPLNDGVITGRVVGGDGVTPIPGVYVTFRSRSPYYGRPWNASYLTAADGTFAVQPNLTLPYVRVLPREAFDLTVKKDAFGTQALTVAGDFAATGVRDLTGVAGRVLNTSSTYPHSCCVAANATDGSLTSVWSAATGDSAAPPHYKAPFFEVAFPAEATVQEVRIRGRRDADTYRIRRARVEVRAGTVVLWSTEVELPLPDRDADVPVPAIEGALSVRLVSLADGNLPGLAEFQVIGEGPLGATGRVEMTVPFAGRGVVEGRVLYSDGTPMPGGSVKLQTGTLWESTNVTAAGTFLFPLVPPASYTMTSTPSLAGGFTVTLTDRVVTADQKLTQDIVYPALGALQVSFFSATGQAVNAHVAITGGGLSRSNSSSPTYSFLDLPPGTYTLTATDSRPYFGPKVVQTVEVPAGPATQRDVTFPPVGKAEVTVTVNGSPLAGSQVYWRSDTRGPEWNYEGVTDALGRRTINNISGTFTVEARHPSNTLSTGQATASLTAEAQIVPVTVEVPGVASVGGVARSRDGVAYAGVRVRALRASDGYQFAYDDTDASGVFEIGNLPVGAIRLRAEKTEAYGGYWQYDHGEVSGTLASHGTTLSLDALIPRGTIGAAGHRDLWETTLPGGVEAAISGVGVVNGTAAALADPYLEVYAPDGSLAASNDDRTASDKNPKVTFTPAQTGTYVVSIRAADGGTGGYRMGGSGGNIPVFRLYAGAIVEGTVTDQAGGAPVSGATVRLTYSGGPTGVSSGSALTVTAADGGYRFTSVPVGASATVAVLDGSGTVLASASGTTGAAGDVLDLDLVRPGLGTVNVSATRNGVPAPALVVTITSDNPVAASALNTRSGPTGGSGAVSFTGVPIGVIEAAATDPATGLPVDTTGTLVAGATLSLDLLLPQNSDATPPAAVGDLAATSPETGIATLIWTAPGDDNTSGTASAYDLRYAALPITETSFDTAAPVSIPAPASAGTPQTVTLPLIAGETYHFALKTRDEAYNWSALSNVAAVTVTGLPTAGLKMWLRADAGVTLTGGNYVSAWADQSGSSNHAAQGTASAQPLLVEDEANGRPVLRFDGTADHLLFTTRLTTIRTAFLVVKEQAGAANAYRTLLGDATDYHFLSDHTHKIWSSIYAHANVRNGETRLNSTVINGTTTDRPTTLSLLSVVTTGNVTADSFSRDRGNGRHWLGDLAELVVYDRLLPDAERKQVEDYLALKYALFVPSAVAPAFSPAGGRFTGSVEVSITAALAASVHYTTDGSEPTESSPLYSEPLLLTGTTTVKAKAYESGRSPSAVATVTFIEDSQFAPDDVAGLKFWVRADAGVGTAGQRVAQWTDQSGQGNHLTQSDVWAQPELVPAATGLPVLRFDGVNDLLSFTSRITTMRTVFWIVRESASATGGYRSLFGDSSSYHFLGGSARQIWDATYAHASIRNGQTRINGTIVTGTSTNKPTALSVISLVTTGPVEANQLTRDRTYAGRDWWGDVAEVIVYDTALSDTDRAAVEQYLAARHGITLP